MKILFTGASSFSGMWFVNALVQMGHEVTPIFTFPYEAYMGIRKQRVDEVLKLSHPTFGAPFGSKAFLASIASSSSWNMLCHHGADVANYKSPDFNPSLALVNNTHNLKDVLHLLKERGCCRVVLTGSVFEQNEGAGSENLRAVSPYGLSKGLTSDTFVFYTSMLQMQLGKFVIPNPFGAFEEHRFTSYLAQHWLSRQTPVVNTPEYVRDNIPVSLLAHAYAQFATQLSDSSGFVKYNPSFFAESIGNFTARFSKAMQSRFTVPCPYKLNPQIDFSEPLVRINTDSIDANTFHWNGSQFWDELAIYYTQIFR